LGYLDGVSSISLLHPPPQPSPTKGFLSFVDTGCLVFISKNYREPSCSQVKKQNYVKICQFWQTTGGFSVVSTDDNETTRVKEGLRVSSKSPWLARWKEQGNGRNSIQVSKFTTIFFTEKNKMVSNVHKSRLWFYHHAMLVFH